MGLAAYSVMLANEASGIGDGRIALYLHQVSLAQPCHDSCIYSGLRSNVRGVVSIVLWFKRLR